MFLLNILIIYLHINFLSCAQNNDFADSIDRARILIEKYVIEEGIPGIVAGISVNGTQLWTEGFGYSDIENNVKCNQNTVMRIASITKSLGTTLVSKLVEQGMLDWDLDINNYISDAIFPKKQWRGETVNITLRQLISHVSGIRTTEEYDYTKLYWFENVTQTLVMFANDPLVAKPNTEFYYSNFGWQLIGAIVESVTGQRYETLINNLFAEFGMNSTRMESRYTIIAHRSRQYLYRDKSKNYILQNTAMIDYLRPFPNWPCGGVVSTVPDLLTFADIMLKSYKTGAFLKNSTVRELWTARNFTLVLEKFPNDLTGSNDAVTSYGMGWDVTNFNTSTNRVLSDLLYIHHSGGLSGTSTLLALFPRYDTAVAIIANIGGLSQLPTLAVNILSYFRN